MRERACLTIYVTGNALMKESILLPPTGFTTPQLKESCFNEHVSKAIHLAYRQSMQHSLALEYHLQRPRLHKSPDPGGLYNVPLEQLPRVCMQRSRLSGSKYILLRGHFSFATSRKRHTSVN